MEAGTGVKLRFVAREVPLAPVAAWARGEAGRALLRALLLRDDAGLARLRGVVAADVVVVTGEAEALPWVDGIGYLGRDDQAPTLLLPTALRTVVATELVERALRARAQGAGPHALIVEGIGAADVPVALSLVSLSGSLPLDRGVIAARLDEGARRGGEDGGAAA